MGYMMMGAMYDDCVMCDDPYLFLATSSREAEMSRM